MKLLFWTLVAITAAVLASFAASNRETVSLALWPLPSIAQLPLYLAVLAALFIGFVAGAVAMWVGGRRTRRRARERARRIAALERELAATQAQLPDLPRLAQPG
jgi:uncharacterized integral membrane protein